MVHGQTGQAVFPGVLLVEHMAQLGCYLLMLRPESKGKLAYFAAIDNVTFERAIVPGDTVRTNVSILMGRRGFWKIRAESRVDGELVCSGDLACVLVEH